MYELIKNYLTEEPRARERHLRDRAMVNLLLRKYKLEELSKDKLVDFCHDFESYCRIWRKVVEENKELRGKDYNTKEITEQNYLLKVGYEPHFRENILKLRTL